MRGVTCAIDTVIQVSKVFFLISFAMFCPRLFLFYSVRSHNCQRKDTSFKLGLENINEITKKLFSIGGKEPRIALVTNQAGVDQAGKHVLDILTDHGLQISKVLVPSNGKKAEGQNALHTAPHERKIPIESMCVAFDTLNDQLFVDVDMIVFDLPDISLSYSAYLKVLDEILLVAAAGHKAVVILDRPNLSGQRMEGALTDLQRAGDFSVPLRSGMTAGELSTYINKEQLSAKVDLRVVPMCNFKRSHDEQKDLLEHLAHAGISTCQLSGYSFLGLLSQVSPFDVGIGTDRAFECLLLPESAGFGRQKWYELQVSLRNVGIESRFYRYFCPARKEYCSGLRFSMQSIHEHSTFNTLLSVLMFFKKSGLDLSFSACFDQTVGTPLVREVVQGRKSHELLKEKVNAGLQTCFNKARESFLYQPLPELVFV